jgi:hypothetical protein
MLAAVGHVLIFVLGTLAVFWGPQPDINLTQISLVAYYTMFK